MSFYEEETISFLQGLETAYFLQGKALQEINCFRSLQERNPFLPSKTHDIGCFFGREIEFKILVKLYWYPCFGFLVTSPPSFKARVGSALFALQRQM